MFRQCNIRAIKEADRVHKDEQRHQFPEDSPI
jgi:hypothetical protein